MRSVGLEFEAGAQELVEGYDVLLEQGRDNVIHLAGWSGDVGVQAFTRRETYAGNFLAPVPDAPNKLGIEYSVL